MARGVSPSPQVLSRGKTAASTSMVSSPARADQAAAADPAGPAPTTRTSVFSGSDCTPTFSQPAPGDADSRSVPTAHVRAHADLVALRVGQHGEPGRHVVGHEGPPGRERSLDPRFRLLDRHPDVEVEPLPRLVVPICLLEPQREPLA